MLLILQRNPRSPDIPQSPRPLQAQPANVGHENLVNVRRNRTSTVLILS
jgi:hypothetical protein